MIACSVAKVTMVSVLKDTMIMLMPMPGVLVLVIVWPDVALILPTLISDDLSMLHSATPTDPADARTLRRITVEPPADAPV
jgi:hypothetical protein